MNGDVEWYFVTVLDDPVELSYADVARVIANRTADECDDEASLRWQVLRWQMPVIVP